QIFPVTATGTFNTGTLSDLRLDTSDAPPQATSMAEFGVNLPANASPPAIGVFDPNNAATFNHSTAVTVYDSLGASHVASAYFVKTANPNEWEARFFVDGTAVGGANTMVYSNVGVLTTPATASFNLPAHPLPNGAEPLTLNASFVRSTQYGSSFGVNSLNQNGFASGRLSSIDVDSQGVVFAR